MKNILALIITLFAFSFSYGQASDVAHQTVMAQGIEQVKLDLGTKSVEIKQTKGSRIIIESRVTLSIPNQTLLNYLIDAGRYGLETSVDPATATMTIKRKRNNNLLIVKGQECEEQFHYTIFLPESVKFSEDISTSASNN